MPIETEWTLLDILSRLDKLESNPPEASSDLYTPTLFNVTNVDGSTAYECQWLRVGNIVTVSGRVDIDPTAAAPTATELGISLPIASALTAGTQLAGTGWSLNVSSQGGPVLADTVNDRASYQFLAQSVANAANFFIFTYQIL